MKIEVSHRDDAIHAAVQGDLSSGAYADAFMEIRKAFSEQPRDVVLDLGGVEHISSFALAGVLRLQQFVRSQQCGFRLSNPSSTVRNILSKTGMDKHFQELMPPVDTPVAIPEAATSSPVTSSPIAPAEATPALAGLPEAPRPGRERLASQIRALEELLAEHQAMTDERDKLAKAVEQDALTRRALETELQASGQRIQALEHERDALSSLKTQLETAQKELADDKARMATLERDCRKAQEAQVLIETMLVEAKAHEEQLSGQTESLTGCLTEIQEKIQRQMALHDLGSAGNEDSLQLPVFARDEAERLKPTRPRL